MQHSKALKTKGAPAGGSKQINKTLNNGKDDEENEFEPPDYFKHFIDYDSQIKDKDYFQSSWQIDFANDNEEKFEIEDQVLKWWGIHSDEEDAPKGYSKISGKQMSPIINNDRIETDEAKVKSLKPRSKIIKKNMKSHLEAAKLSNSKETTLKNKLKKSNIPTEKHLVKDMVAIVKTESKETFPNTSDGTMETKVHDLYDFNKSGPFSRTPELSNIAENAKVEEGLANSKTKSQLSLKSKAYTRTGNVKNLHNNTYNSFDNLPKMSQTYHRHSLPHMPLEWAANIYHFTPSTNYTIPSSEEKLSAHGPPINQSMSMNVLSPVPFEKEGLSGSMDAFHTLDNSNYANYQKEGLVPPGNYFSNTTPLPNMGSFNKGISYSPDFNMGQYPYYNVNAASTGRISSSSDWFPNAQSPPQYYQGTMGKSWPKISHPGPDHGDKYSTISQNYRNKNAGRVSTKENDQQKRKYLLDFNKILAGKDKRTSLMIRNIPNKYNQTMLTQELDENHKGLYDYIYLPIDPKNKCNCGYAFINVVHPTIILSLYIEFNGKSWRNFNSEKICELTYGRLQGREQLLKQLEGSGVMQQSDSAKKPLILDTVQPSEELLEKIKQDFIENCSFP